MGETSMLSGTACWVRYQDSPRTAARGFPRTLLRWKSAQYSMAVGSRHCRVGLEAVGSLAVVFPWR